MRPGAKFRLWSPKYTNRPDIEPPTLLRLVSALSILSAVGFLFYSVARGLDHTGATDTTVPGGYYVAILHFVLPVGIFYTVVSNSPWSRPAIALYMVILGGATLAGLGVLGNLNLSDDLRVIVTIFVTAAVFAWLFASPRMRFYYASLTNAAIPDDLQGRAEELSRNSRLSRRAHGVVEWILDSMETIVMIGFIILCLYMFLTTYA